MKIYKEIKVVSDDDDIILKESSSIRLFENANHNNSFSTPDRMIQGLLKSTAVVPSFLKNNHFTNKDFSETLIPINREMSNIIQMNKNNNPRKKKRNFLRNITRKVNKSTDERKKRVVLRKLAKKPNKQNKSSKPKTKSKK